MRDSVVWLLSVGSAAVALIYVLVGRPTPADRSLPVRRTAQVAPEAGQEQAVADNGAGTTPEGPVSEAPSHQKIVYTFRDQGEMRTFVQLLQRRQELLLQLAVLRDYWTKEQARLVQLSSEQAEGARAPDAAEAIRQAIRGRMAVLEEYWNPTEKEAGQISGELQTRYSIDLAKRYEVNPARRALVELEQSEGSAPAAAPGPSQERGFVAEPAGRAP